MNREVMALVEEMVQRVAGLRLGEIGEVDSIWDKNYDKLVELAVDENCGERETCDEEVIHDEMADIRVMYYEAVEEYSCSCRGCGRALYGRMAVEGGCLCGRCENR